MSLQHLTFNDIDEKALTALVSGGVMETKTLEFKVDLQVATDEQKQEFMSDVTALANSDGGDLVIGLRAEKGVAKELVGLRNFVPDDRIGQLENLLRDFVQPRLMGLQVVASKLDNGNHVLIIRIGRSFAAPHMVRHQGVTRFCGRNSNGKYDLDVQELRSAFLASETMSDKLRNFRLDRINKLISSSGPIRMSSPHMMVLHLLPLVSVRSDFRLGISDFSKFHGHNMPRPMRVQGYSPTHNIDGFFVASSWKDAALDSYVQVYRNGFIESVESELLNFSNPGETKALVSGWEDCILRVLPCYMDALKTLGITPPYVASISLLGVRGFKILTDGRHFSLKNASDRDNLLSDEILIEDSNAEPEKVLKPLFDQIWNGFGWDRSMNYDEKGNRREGN
jgi:hypothetical protein